MGDKHEPKFIGIGGQRCGSTSLYDYVCQHPDVSKNRLRKELHYFDHGYRQRELGWYLEQFPEFSGEFTPTYMFHSWAVDRIMNDLETRPLLLVTLRNPADRAVLTLRTMSRCFSPPVPS